jgi:hypothetical protein
MASFNTYTGNGVTTNYAVSFQYIDQDHVKASLNGVETEDWTWLTSSSIQFDTAPGDGVTVTIFRETPRSAPLVDFSNGSALLEADLDLASLQALYVAEEAYDGDALTPEELAAAEENMADLLAAAEAAAVVAQDAADQAVGGISGLNTDVFSFTGDGVTTVFDIGHDIDVPARIHWFEDGIWQHPGVDFTVSGTEVTRTTAPADGAVICGVFIGGVEGPEGPEGADGEDGGPVPVGGTTGQVLVKQSNDDGDVDWEDTAPVAIVARRFSDVGDGVTTAFDLDVLIPEGTDPIDADALLLWFEDGVIQRHTTDFTVSGTTVTRTTAPVNGAVITGWLLQ